MTPGNGRKPPTEADKSLGEIVAEVSEKASMLVREEIELAKTEIQQKVGRLAKGSAVAVAAGVFGFFALILFLQALSWFFTDLFDWEPWSGYLLTAGLLVLLGALAGFLAYRFISKGSPPTPDLAIEQARLTREALDRQATERDQLERGKEKASG